MKETCVHKENTCVMIISRNDWIECLNKQVVLQPNKQCKHFVRLKVARDDEHGGVLPHNGKKE